MKDQYYVAVVGREDQYILGPYEDVEVAYKVAGHYQAGGDVRCAVIGAP